MKFSSFGFIVVLPLLSSRRCFWIALIIRGAQTVASVGHKPGGVHTDDSLKGAGRHHHSNSNSATHAGPTPAMAIVMTAVAAFSALRCITPRPSDDPPIFIVIITLSVPHRLPPVANVLPTRRNPRRHRK
jgi:hypothetical protein